MTYGCCDEELKGFTGSILPGCPSTDALYRHSTMNLQRNDDSESSHCASVFSANTMPEP